MDIDATACRCSKWLAFTWQGPIENEGDHVLVAAIGLHGALHWSIGKQ